MLGIKLGFVALIQMWSSILRKGIFGILFAVRAQPPKRTQTWPDGDRFQKGGCRRSNDKRSHSTQGTHLLLVDGHLQGTVFIPWVLW